MNREQFANVYKKIVTRQNVNGKLCSTCMKEIKNNQRVELNIKEGTARHAKCVELRPMQKKAIAELERVMANINNENQ